MEGFDAVNEIANACNGKVEWSAALPDGSGTATVSFPLPTDHWIYGDPSVENKGDGWSYGPPPMPLRMGVKSAPIHNMTREMWADALRKAGKYAIRAATMKGKETDFDPDAMLQNLVVGFLGYWTDDGLSNDDFANPKEAE